MWQRRIFNLLLFFCITIFLAVILLAYIDHNEMSQTENQAKNLIQQEFLIAIKQIDSELKTYIQLLILWSRILVLEN